MPQLGKRARATPRQPAGGCARARKPRPGVWLYGGAQSGQRASLMARPGQVGTPSSCQLWAKEVPGTQDQPDQSRNRPVCKETPAKGRLRVRVRSRSHPGRGVLTSAQRLRVRSPSRPALPLAPECSVSYVHHRVAVYGALPSTLTAEWQCEVHCHSLPSVPVALPLGPDRTDTVRSMLSGSEERTATRP